MHKCGEYAGIVSDKCLNVQSPFEMQEVTVSLAKYIILKVQCDLLNFQGS